MLGGLWRTLWQFSMCYREDNWERVWANVGVMLMALESFVRLVVGLRPFMSRCFKMLFAKLLVFFRVFLRRR